MGAALQSVVDQGAFAFGVMAVDLEEEEEEEEELHEVDVCVDAEEVRAPSGQVTVFIEFPRQL